MKYGNVPTNVGDKSFHSKLEASRYTELSLLAKAGEISSLETQVGFRFDVGGYHVCNYIADFVYLDRNGKQVVEDTKGVITPEFRIKKKLMKAVHGIDVQLVFAKQKFPKRWGRK